MASNHGSENLLKFHEMTKYFGLDNQGNTAATRIYLVNTRIKKLDVYRCKTLIWV